MPLFLLLNRLFVLSSSPLSIVSVCVCVCPRVGVRILVLLYVRVPHSHRQLLTRDTPLSSDHHRPGVLPASFHAQPHPHQRADHHASDSSDPELRPHAGRQSAHSANAARARIWNHLHALRVSLHTHALHIGIPDRLKWSFRYFEIKR